MKIRYETCFPLVSKATSQDQAPSLAETLRGQTPITHPEK
jgi:hypothetical protein